MFSPQLFTTKWFRAILSSSLVMIFLISYALPSQAGILEDVLTVIFGYKKRDVKGVAESRPQGGGGRGECSQLANDTNKQLTALIPPSEISPEVSSVGSSPSVDLKSSLKVSSSPEKILPSNNTINEKLKTVPLWSNTLEEKPTLWFYIPYKYNEQSEIEYAKFALIDEEKHLVREPIRFKLPEKPGIAQVRIPISLTRGKVYQWFFSVVCDENKPSRNPSVTGWIHRTEQDNQRLGQLSQAYLYYAKWGLWYDSLTRLVEAYQSTKKEDYNQSYPYFTNDEVTKIQKDWFDVFELVKLSDDIAKEPNIIQLECIPSSNNQQCQ
ncbi:DUF928 domain-containing protein [Nostoc sp.]|uniref:DUF928 domain-containing protein n=1 Tax=Nostoc sp. TaxID=1180 RepID=UPI002FF45FC1